MGSVGALVALPTVVSRETWRVEMPKWFDKENAPQDKAPAGGRSKDTGGKAGSGRVDNRKDPKDDKMTDRKDK